VVWDTGSKIKLMRKKRLFWQIFPFYLLVVIISLFAATWYSSSSLRCFYLQKVAEDLEARARFVKRQVSGHLTAETTQHVNSLCKELGKETSTRITVILMTGQVIGDTEEDPVRMEDHSDRPEIREAISGKVGTSTRYSHTLKKNMMYVAIPVIEENEVAGVVRTSTPLASIGETLSPIYVEIAFGVLVIAAAATALGFVISKRISRPLEDIRRGAERFAQGDLSVRLPVPETEEIGGLAQTMNEMARQLDERIQTITQQSNEQQAIFSSMAEGVLAVDADERVISINQAAGEMLGVNPDEARGRTIQEAIRNSAIQKFVAQVLSSKELVENDVVLQGGEEKFLHLHGAVLRNVDGQATGAVVVLNDVTRLRKLENIRREMPSGSWA
jgi:two-component system phosphate regulon sensor histidine kinase PhoR